MAISALGITPPSQESGIKETNGLTFANGSTHPNPLTSDYDSTLIDLFSRSVSLYPDAAALEDQTEGQVHRHQITYHDLHVASNCFSQRLRDHGVTAGDIVPVLGRRSVDMVIALLSVLKLRACYVPIDLDSWGPDRINTTLDMIDGRILISLDLTPSVSLKVRKGYQVVVLDDWSIRKHIDLDIATNMQAIKAQLQDKNATWPPPANDLAYIIFTSGTTGLPKGVMITQRSIAAYVQSCGDLPFNTNACLDSRILLICSVAFDACTAILFSALCNGATIVLADPSTLVSAARTCTTLVLTPSILSTLDPDEESMVETIFLGGEQTSAPLIKAWATRKRRLYNGYGPTETTCGSLMAELKPNLPVLLGHSIHYGRVVLVDDAGREAEEGELYITGLGVAVGYYRNEELTAKSFVQWNGERAYRTGDFGRQTSDGIMFLGRRDSFVKNRGFLINLEGDVEPAMSSFPKVKTSVALQHNGRLYGIVTPQTASDGLRDYLAEHYSAFIIPDIVISRDTLPSTTNGKIDRKSLLEVIIESESQAEVVEAGEILTPEAAVQKVFSQTLGVSLLNINLSSSFRDLGGHSLASIVAVAALRKLSFFITVPEVLQLDTVSAISLGLRTSDHTNSNVLAIFDSRSRELRDAVVTDALESDIEEVAPMTDMQARLVQTSIDLPGQNFVKVAMTFEHKDPKTPEIIRQAWSTVLQRHSIFRTSYLLSVNNGVQLVHGTHNLSWNEINVSEEIWDSACVEAEEFGPDYLATFDEKSLKSLSHFQIITIPGNRSRLFWRVHHSLIDGWSISNILSEVQATSDGQVLEDIPPQFSKAALWIELEEGKDREAAKVFWSKRLQDVISNSNIQAAQPSDHAPLPMQSERNMAVALKMTDLNKFARALHVTTASVIYSAWAMVLSRYTGSDKVVFGAVLAGRNLPIPSVERLTGPLMNSLPFAVEVNEAKNVDELLHTVFTALCETFEYQWSSNSLIQEATGTKGTDFYESMVSLQYDFPKPSSEWKIIGGPKDITYSEVTEVPLTVIVDQEGGNLALRFMYKRSHFSDSQVERLMNHFINILEKLIQSPSTCSVQEATTHMMGTSEVASLLNNSEHLELAYTGPKTLKDALESCAKQWKDHVAVRSTVGQVTYKELDELSNRVANKLVAHVTSGDVVCIFSDGSMEWVIAILAVVKCGAAYCPIDIRLPAERQTLMLEASACSIAFYPTTSSIEDSPVFPGVLAMAVDAVLDEPLQNCDRVERDVSPQDIVCLVFTSGSTGTPKGVQLRHDAILSLLEYEPARLFAKPGQSNAQLLSLGFDGCVKEVFAALCYGATFVLKDPEDPLAHLSSVDATMITPTLLTTMDPEEYPNLKVLTLVGEAVPQILVKKWATGRVLQNGYGPTECTIICLMADLHPSKKVSIGRPVPRTACYILDTKMRPCPIGGIGEIYLSGNQVTTGYLAGPQGKASRFLQDPFRKGWRLYKTGDKARWREDGEVEYIGREDDQIKLRGFRIDLGDVEITIRKVAPEATQAAVIASHGSLIAFVAPSSIDTTSLARQLRAALPHYCQLAHVVALSELPMSPNQKVDRKALAAMPLRHLAISEPLATETEQIVAEIWGDVLGNNRPAHFRATDHFFNIGGHSLLQIRVAQHITGRFGINRPLKLVLRHLILRELCGAIDSALKNANHPPSGSFLSSSRVERSEHMPLSYLEEELLLNYHMAAGKTPAFNIPFAVLVHGELDIKMLGQAFKEAVLSKEIFRSRYQIIDGRAVRKVSSQVPTPTIMAADSDVSRMIKRQVDLTFDLENDDPIRLALITEGPLRTVIVLTMTHLIGDRTTLNNFVRDISIRYSRLRKHGGPSKENSPEDYLGLAYADWSVWAGLQKPETSTIVFWKEYLKGLKGTPVIVGERKLGSFNGSSRLFTLRKSLSHQLLRLAANATVTQHHLALTAVGITMQSLLQKSDIIVGAPFANRLEAGTEGLAGVFLDRLPIRLHFDDTDLLVTDLLKRTHDSSQAAMAHFVPYQQLCKLLGLEAAKHGSLVEMVVSYHMNDESSYDQMELAQTSIEPLRTHVSGSKFPLMFEFSETDSQISIDTEYDTSLFTESTIDSLESALSLTLELMAARCNYTAIKACISSLHPPQMQSPSQSTLQATSRDGDNSKLHNVRSAIAECLNTEVDNVSCEKSIFEIGISSGHCLMLHHLLKIRGITVSLRDILVLQTAEKLANRYLE